MTVRENDMRESKFRVFDKTKKQMIYIDDGWFISFCTNPYYWWIGNANYRDGDLYLASSDNVILMQYIDHKDKNGKDVYPGDIVKIHVKGLRYWNGKQETEWYEYWEVFWDSGCSCFPHAKYALRNENGNYCAGSADSWMCTSYEVVGNIYENAELLEIK